MQKPRLRFIRDFYDGSDAWACFSVETDGDGYVLIAAGYGITWEKAFAAWKKDRDLIMYFEF